MPRTGHPRTFNRDEAVAAAMILFWEYGFESTSLAQLKAAMGDISSASFYAAFKSKEDLFREVIDRYTSMYGHASETFKNTNITSRAAMELGLQEAARFQTENTHPLGCLLVLSTVNCSPEQQHIQDLLSKERPGQKWSGLFHYCRSLIRPTKHHLLIRIKQVSITTCSRLDEASVTSINRLGATAK
ncbi:TetR/AcrR family transcriptional regulator [Paenibacillus lautus]|uniref:TetR/AcrR family transcriptional regulator n=1 Tax=Paenibacillus lautus TaxID=1401 RepID=UPI003D2DB440